MSEMEGHDASWSINMEAAGASPLVEELADMKLAQRKMFDVLVPVITFPAIGVVAGISFGFPGYAVAMFAVFALGSAFVFHSVKFPSASVSAVVAK